MLITLTQDGNLVIYRESDGKPIWNSLTQNTGASSVRMEKDGNLVIYDAQKSPGVTNKHFEYRNFKQIKFFI